LGDVQPSTDAISASQCQHARFILRGSSSPHLHHFRNPRNVRYHRDNPHNASASSTPLRRTFRAGRSWLFTPSRHKRYHPNSRSNRASLPEGNQLSAEPLEREIPASTTRQAIDGVVSEIAQLARAGLAPDDFCAQFLSRVVAALGAAGGAIWLKNEAGQLDICHEINFDRLRVESHRRLLAPVLQGRQPLVLSPGRSDEQGNDALNPTEFLLLLCPLHADGQPLGVIEVLQRPGAHPLAQQGYAEFLRTACDLAEEFQFQQPADSLRDSKRLWMQWEEFTRAVHNSLDVQATAMTLVNDGRLLIGCDRLSVVLKHGTDCRVEAISGQHVINRRANVVRLLEDLVAAVLVLDEPLWRPGTGGPLAPQVERPLERYLNESYAKLLGVLPLGTTLDDGSPGPTSGALVIEQFKSERWDQPAQQRAETVCSHGATALRNAQQYNDIFLLPLWQALGRTRWMVQARALPRTVAVAALMMAVVLGLTLIPADFTVEGPAELQPELRREVYARADGVVGDVRVEHGEDVQPGQVLAELRNTELDFQFTRVLGELQTTRKKLAAVQAARLEGPPAGSRDREQFQSLTSEEEELKESLRSLEEQFQLLSEYKNDLIVTSPIAGRVTTWNVAEQLAARPVRRGQPLLSVADVSGPWVLEIRLPDDQTGHVLAARDHLRPDLAVWYILAAESGVARRGTIKNVAMSVESGALGERSVLVQARLDQTNLPPLRPGATATAKIHCGRRAIGYVWFRGLVEFVQSRVMF
jgi:multidrug efflux pump subunit AcrA (membrane-fusion protein)